MSQGVGARQGADTPPTAHTAHTAHDDQGACDR